MKKSRIAKFALLGASTAALAATLTTSTYAWYVSNKQADIQNGTGSTGSAGSDGSVTLSWTDDADSYFKTLDFADDLDKINQGLQPIHYNTTSDYIYTKVATPVEGDLGTYYTYGTGAFTAASNTFNAETTYYTRATAATAGFYNAEGSLIASNAATSAKTYIQFEVYVKTGDGSTVTPNISIRTTRNTATAQQLHVDEGTPSTKQKGQTLLMDAKYALYVQQVVDGGATTYFQVDGDSSAGNLTDGNAHDYYAAVTGEAPWCVAPVTATGLGTIATTEGVGKKVTYTIYLDGGDTDCFNSCTGWDINFNLTFSIA